jgi:hypothetical protein
MLNTVFIYRNTHMPALVVMVGIHPPLRRPQ